MLRAMPPTLFSSECFEYRLVGCRQSQIVAYVAMTKHVCLVYTEKTSLNYFHTLAIHTDSKIETFDNIYNSRSSGWKRKVNCLSQKKMVMRV